MNLWDKRFIDLAKLISSWSKDPSTKVGSVIVRPNKSVASIGFNGYPQKMLDDHTYFIREIKYSKIIHAEINALLFCLEKITGYTLYTYPLLPCDRCFVQLLQAGITRFVSTKPASDQLSRWGEAIDRVKKYALEADVELLELDYE